MIGRKNERAAVEAFYSARNYAPLWIAGTAANARAKAAIAYLATRRASASIRTTIRRRISSREHVARGAGRGRSSSSPPRRSPLRAMRRSAASISRRVAADIHSIRSRRSRPMCWPSSPTATTPARRSTPTIRRMPEFKALKAKLAELRKDRRPTRSQAEEKPELPRVRMSGRQDPARRHEGRARDRVAQAARHRRATRTTTL